MKYLKKMIAPIIITIIVVLYFICIASLVFISDELPMQWRFVIIMIISAFVIVMISVLISRIKEIRSGEEGNLSQY